MKQSLYLIIIIAAVLMGCTGNGSTKKVGGSSQSEASQGSSAPADTIHTRQAAMSIYGYQPERALQIIDSALIVGNVDEVQAEQCRARIYSFTRMHDQMNSLLGGPKDVRLDSAQAIAERLLCNDTIKADPQGRQWPKANGQGHICE